MLYADRKQLAGQHLRYCAIMRLPAPTEKQGQKEMEKS